MNRTEHLVIKDASFERWTEFLHENRFRFLDPERVWISEICQNLTTAESVELYDALKSDLEQSTTVANDAAPV